MDRAAAEQALADAEAAYQRFDVDAVITHTSAAIRGFTAAGMPREAAVACAQLGDMFSFIGQAAAASVWVARAERLLVDVEPCVEQGWVAMTLVGCEVSDPEVLLARAELALDRARTFGDLDLEAKALADGGLAHVQAGRLERGMAMLEEAMALAAVVQRTDVFGKSACSFYTACYYAVDVERFDRWTSLLHKQGVVGPEPGPPLYLSSHCDTVQAALLVELGRWTEAEQLLERAITDLEAAGIPPWHPVIGLADLRSLQGRWAEAEALLLGKDQVMQALLPSARLHLARGDHRLAVAAATRGLRAMVDDRLRAADLLIVLVEAHLAAGELEAARQAQGQLVQRIGDLPVAVLRARAAGTEAMLLVAEGRAVEATAALETALVELDHEAHPWRAVLLLAQQTAAHAALEQHDHASGAAVRAAELAGRLDVVLPDRVRAVLDRWAGPSLAAATTAVLRLDGSWWALSADGTTVRLKDSKGLRYLAELVRAPGTERHALDLVDRIEGVGDVDRRSLGDVGPLVDAPARTAYRHRIEELRGDLDEALERGHEDRIDQLQQELDALVAQLAQAFGLGGQARTTGSAAEKARLNVTRALRSALARVQEGLPLAGAALDRRVRTGLYCAYEPDPTDGVVWTVA